MIKHISLKELTGIIKSAVSSHTGEYWVVSEIASLKANRKSGHCYLELVEKEDEKTVAQMKGTIWARDYTLLNADFKHNTGKELSAGMKVLLLGRASFHNVYGLSFNIYDIDPSYTLGEMALKRKQTIERLAKEGVIDLNKKVPFPLVPQRIAVISSETAAGFGDFINRINNNPYGYSFGLALHEAYMQGEQAERSILKALASCRKKMGRYDLLVIIRGGGSQAELHCFDSYKIARETANLSVPVLTGIGHERDETVLDRVAHRRLITPTAVAEFIISRVRLFEEMVDGLSDRLLKHAEGLLISEENSLAMHSALLHSMAERHLSAQTHRLLSLTKDFDHASIHFLTSMQNSIDRASTSLSYQTERYVSAKLDAVDRLDTKVALLDPAGVLKRGYSITSLNGKALRNASDIRPGDIIDTRLWKGSIKSRVDKIRENGNGS
jgi:exodeoxyribonuclease VII large subunit